MAKLRRTQVILPKFWRLNPADTRKAIMTGFCHNQRPAIITFQPGPLDGKGAAGPVLPCRSVNDLTLQRWSCARKAALIRASGH